MTTLEDLPLEIHSIILQNIYAFSLNDIQKVKHAIENFQVHECFIISTNHFNTFNERIIFIRDHTKVVVIYNNGRFHNCYIYTNEPLKKVNIIGIISPSSFNIYCEDFVFNSTLGFVIVLIDHLSGYFLNADLKYRAKKIKQNLE